MIKAILIAIFLVSTQIKVCSQISSCDSIDNRIQQDLDSLAAFDLFMKDRIYNFSLHTAYDNNFSFGIGYYFYSDFISRYRRFPTPSFETNLSYHLDGYLHHNFSIQLPYLITPSFNLSTYTDFENTSLLLRPGAGINAYIIHFDYRFNWVQKDYHNLSTKHQVSLIYRFGIIDNVWKSAGDILQSQYDRRKLRKNSK